MCLPTPLGAALLDPASRGSEGGGGFDPAIHSPGAAVNSPGAAVNGPGAAVNSSGGEARGVGGGVDSSSIPGTSGLAGQISSWPGSSGAKEVRMAALWRQDTAGGRAPWAGGRFHVALVLFQLCLTVLAFSTPLFERRLSGSLSLMLAHYGFDFTGYYSMLDLG